MVYGVVEGSLDNFLAKSVMHKLFLLKRRHYDLPRCLFNKDNVCKCILYQSPDYIAQLVEHWIPDPKVVGSSPAVVSVRDSIVASIPACHAGDRGSIPRRGAFWINSLALFIVTHHVSSFVVRNSFVVIHLTLSMQYILALLMLPVINFSFFDVTHLNSSMVVQSLHDSHHLNCIQYIWFYNICQQISRYITYHFL